MEIEFPPSEPQVLLFSAFFELSYNFLTFSSLSPILKTNKQNDKIFLLEFLNCSLYPLEQNGTETKVSIYDRPKQYGL